MECNKLLNEAIDDLMQSHKSPDEVKLYRASNYKDGKSKGAIGEGTYYFKDEQLAIDRAKGTDKKLYNDTVESGDIINHEQLVDLLGKDYKLSDLRKPETIKLIKESGFKGVNIDNEVVIY